MSPISEKKHRLCTAQNSTDACMIYLIVGRLLNVALRLRSSWFRVVKPIINENRYLVNDEIRLYKIYVGALGPSSRSNVLIMDRSAAYLTKNPRDH